MSLRGFGLSLAGALLCACHGPKTYEGTHYRVAVDSEPSGGELFVIKRSAWDKIAQNEEIPSRDVLLSNDTLVSAQGEAKMSPHVTPVLGLRVPERKLVLVVLHATGQSFMFIEPSKDGEEHLVRLN